MEILYHATILFVWIFFSTAWCETPANEILSNTEKVKAIHNPINLSKLQTQVETLQTQVGIQKTQVDTLLTKVGIQQTQVDTIQTQVQQKDRVIDIL